MALAAGTRIGAYEIIDQIGVGGMGEVYRARDVNLGRDVAIKVLPNAVAQDAERLARFEREAKTLAVLSHPNIAIVHGFEKGGEIRALVMELVKGPTLADRIAKGPIPTDEALPIAKQIAEALEAAHEQGVIHRDLKPANIKVRDDATVKVLDFGLAKLIESGSGGRDSGFDRTMSPTITTPAMTQLGVILGTAAYMAPEQARGKAVDKRSDIWAFGCVLFEMLTGSRPFDGEDVTDMIAAVVRADPKWDALPADTPAPIRLLLKRCLEKDRKKRIGDIAAVLFVLDEATALQSETTAVSSEPATAKRSLWKRAMPVLAGLLLTAAVVGAIAWTLRPPAATPQVIRFSLQLPSGQVFTNTGRPLVAIAPDGSRLVYVANRRLYVRSLSDSQPREIQGSLDSQGVTTPTFSPDGQSIAFVSAGDRALKRISVDGGAAIAICPIVTSHGVSWGPDGIVFGQRPGNIYRVSPNGGTPQMIFKASEDEAAFGAQVLPGGDAMLVTVGRLTSSNTSNPDQLENPHVEWRSLTSTEHVTLIERGADAHYLPTGHIVYADGGALLAVRFDPATRKVSGEAVPIVQGVRRANATPAAQFAVSSTGMLVYVPGTDAADFTLGMTDRQGGTETLKVPNATYNFPRLSPDGKQLAVEINNGGVSQIGIYDLSGGHSIRQLTMQGDNRFPVWSPDGQRITYASNRGGDVAIWWQRADGTGSAERLTVPDKGTQHAPMSWHPREPALLYISRAGTPSLSLYTANDKTGRAWGNIRSDQNMSAQFSPDGKWVAYSLDIGNRPSVLVRPYPITDTVYAVGAGSHPLWSPDGMELFYARGGTIYVTRVTTRGAFANSEPAVLNAGSWVPAFQRNFDSVDGKRFVTVMAGSASDARDANAQEIEIVLNWFEELKRLVPAR